MRRAREVENSLRHEFKRRRLDDFKRSRLSQTKPDNRECYKQPVMEPSLQPVFQSVTVITKTEAVIETHPPKRPRTAGKDVWAGWQKRLSGEPSTHAQRFREIHGVEPGLFRSLLNTTLADKLAHKNKIRTHSVENQLLMFLEYITCLPKPAILAEKYGGGKATVEKVLSLVTKRIAFVATNWFESRFPSEEDAEAIQEELRQKKEPCPEAIFIGDCTGNFGLECIGKRSGSNCPVFCHADCPINSSDPYHYTHKQNCPSTTALRVRENLSAAKSFPPCCLLVH